VTVCIPADNQPIRWKNATPCMILKDPHTVEVTRAEARLAIAPQYTGVIQMPSRGYASGVGWSKTGCRASHSSSCWRASI
jgi:hypothetical protein